MQLYPILLVAVILVADGVSSASPHATVPYGRTVALLLALAPPFLIVVASAVGFRWCSRQLDAGQGPRPIIIADRLLSLARWLLLAVYALAVLLGGWAITVRRAMGEGDLILVDELVILLPPVLGLLGLWWTYYPLERRVREALFLRRIDMGRPIYPMPARARYVVQQARLHLLLLLVPVLIILALSETIRIVYANYVGDHPLRWTGDIATFVGGLGVFLLSPLLARVVLSVEPLPAGSVRDDLEEICLRHRVSVREMLLWKTDGAMLNAAVMGLAGRLRYVLLTDGVIDTLTRQQVLAVMAHEIGHVRRHHMPWLVMSLLAMLMLATFLVGIALTLGQYLGYGWEAGVSPWVEGAATLAAVAAAMLGFGWISRRYERQADTFAVQHLSGLGAGAPEENRAITPDAVDAMRSALEVIAQSNTVDRHRRSWRHGSIAWRQDYLSNVVGHPIDRLPIDGVVRRLQILCAIVVLGGGAAVVLATPWGSASLPAQPLGPHGSPHAQDEAGYYLRPIGLGHLRPVEDGGTAEYRYFEGFVLQAAPGHASRKEP